MNIQDLKVGDKVKSRDDCRHYFSWPDRIWTVLEVEDHKVKLYSGAGHYGEKTIENRDMGLWQLVKDPVIDLI